MSEKWQESLKDCDEYKAANGVVDEPKSGSIDDLDNNTPPTEDDALPF